MDSLTGGKKAAITDVFAGGGEMGELMRDSFGDASRTHDWSKSILGPVENWAQSLKTSIRIILGSRYPMFVWWGQELLNFYNDAYIPVLGKRHPEALGQPARDIWTDVWHLVGPLAEDVMNLGKPSWNEELLEIMERNGYPEETYFTFSYSPISNDDGGVEGVFCACTEDTRRVLDDRRLRTLRELGAETAKAKTVDETCNISTSVLANNPHDIPFALIYLLERASQKAQLVSTTGLAVGTLASPKTIELSLVPSADCWSLNSVLATGKSLVIEDLVERFGLLRCGAWSTSPKRAIALPLQQPGQEILGVLIVGISPLRPLDDDYQGFFDLVEGQVTMAIANAHTYEEERKRVEALAELDRAKTAFFSNVSHEFRTPLTLLINPLEDVLAGEHGQLLPQQREQLAIAQRNAMRLLKLVNTLLDFSRIESGRIQAVYEPTDLAAFTADLASVFRSAIETAGLQLIVDCQPLSNLVYVDREMWEKIVLNLISNAFKFTFTGEIAISLHQINDKVELKIQDTGTGITDEELPQIFERFHRIRGVQARSHEGSGIGLALVAELIHLHSGTVSVESVVDVGTTFRVTLPTGSSHLPSEQISAKPTLASTSLAVPYVQEAQQWLLEKDTGTQGRGDAGNYSLSVSSEVCSTGGTPARNFSPRLNVFASSSTHILLVDDNADMRDYLKRLLQEQWQVEAVKNGADALTAISLQLPDLVLTDVMMPEVDGFQLLRALRADPKTKGLPIILLSARAGEEAAIEGLQAGADDYLIKPFSAQELIARIDSHLQMARLRQELSTNRLKDEFLATVTHELHAPLVAILGWTRLLRSNQLDRSSALRALDTIERNANNQAMLIEDLLNISTILSGKVHIDREPVNLTSTVGEVIQTMFSDAQAKTIQIVETLHVTSLEKDICVCGDLIRLQQVFSKLLHNAIKFTPKGGNIEVRLDAVDSWAIIQVSDNGIGISADFLPHVFDRFTQEEVPSRHLPGGLGLGLAIARQLVELHDGTIEAVSDGIGRGTTFTVKLPLKEDAITQVCFQ
ncbi:ATP-binding protein [Dendronalium sp. ChiSLP03b]|uniref:hybrid sensor histidine kinase/response regulator n=1 Tax=Dendronalium sp. ChiSLP03b TaxID=3075381 RepID=UPI002AD372F7|nr:ATP-binding protein [Dendronalium sp. ChiSLP03b]MDZ8203605.1 ATP-binding protein [Dendronalium sp. ChiSLP03b]